MVDVKPDANDASVLAETVVLDQADLDTTVLASESEDKVETTASETRNKENLAEENNGHQVVGGMEEKNGHVLMAGGEGKDSITGEEGRDLVAGEEGDKKDKYRDEDAKGKNKNEEGETEDKKNLEGERGDEKNEENATDVIEGKVVEKEVADNGKSKEIIGKKVDENSAVKVRKPIKRIRKVMQGAPNKLVSKDEGKPESLRKKKVLDKVVSKDEDKPESSDKKKISKVESMGMIFMCTSETKKDCYHYKLLGLPAGKKDIVEKIYKGMRLFLFDLDLRLMYGIYKAASPGGSNIEPKAFKSAFPSQVRFTVLEDCLPLAEEKFKKVLKDNYYSRNKFHCQLTSEQVKKLCKLFVSSSKGSALQKVGKSLVAGRHISEGQYKNIRQGQDVKRGLKRRDREEDLGHKQRERGRIQPDQDEERGRKRRGQREGRKYPVRQVQRTHERSITYADDVFLSQVEPQHRGHQLPAPLHGYERTLEMNPYRRGQVLEHGSVRLVDLEPRHHHETKNLDPYLSYREIESPCGGPIYSSASEREYYTPSVLPAPYRPVGGYTTSGLRDYYQLETLPSEYLSTPGDGGYLDLAGLSNGYRRVGPSTQYRASAGVIRDYHSSHSLQSMHRY